MTDVPASIRLKMAAWETLVGLEGLLVSTLRSDAPLTGFQRSCYERARHWCHSSVGLLAGNPTVGEVRSAIGLRRALLLPLVKSEADYEPVWLLAGTRYALQRLDAIEDACILEAERS